MRRLAVALALLALAGCDDDGGDNVQYMRGPDGKVLQVNWSTKKVVKSDGTKGRVRMEWDMVPVAATFLVLTLAYRRLA